MIEPFAIDSSPRVQGFIHRADSPIERALVVTHGAGSNCQAPLLVALADFFAAAGFLVLRCDLPYRQQRPHGPPFRGDAEKDREGLRRAAEAVRKLMPPDSRMILGGHSYGGRQASMLSAEDSAIADGLLLLSYPLHPPNKPEEARTAHFPSLQVPAYFVHGTRDPFASSEQIETAVKLVPAPHAILHLEGAGHDLVTGGRAGRANRVRETALQIGKSALEFFG